jgi:hypothetical protein
VIRPKLNMTRGALRSSIFLFVFSLALASANLVFTAHDVNRVTAVESAASHSAASVVQLCRAGNEFRAENLGLWLYIVHIARPPAHETRREAQQRQAVTDQFLAHLRQVFAPRRCQIARSG